MGNNDSPKDSLLKANLAYWDAILNASKEGQPTHDWAQMSSQHQQQRLREMPEEFARLVEILTKQSHNFMQYAQELLLQCNSEEKQSLHTAILQFQNYMQEQTCEALMQQWQLPEQFTSLFKSHSFRDDLLFENPFSSGLKSLLETPAVGSNQQSQQLTREAIKLAMEYQEALGKYVEHYNSINKSAGQAMQQILSSGEQDVSSLQQLHSIWVETYESAYIDKISTDAYQRAHGRISNALMKLKKFAQDSRDIYFQAAGLATRKGLDTALKRQHQLRKDMRNQQREIGALKAQVQALQAAPLAELVDTLRQEVADLKHEVKQLQKANSRKDKP